MKKHPIISAIEIKFAFEFKNFDEVEKFILPLIEENFVEVKKVKNTYLLEVKK